MSVNLINENKYFVVLYFVLLIFMEFSPEHKALYKNQILSFK